MFLMTSLQLRFLLASIPRQPFHLQPSPDQLNQLNQPDQLNQPKLAYQPLQPLSPLEAHQPHQEVVLKSIDDKETDKARVVEEETSPWKKRAPGHILLYIPPNVAKHARNKGFTDGSTGFPGMKKLATNGLFSYKLRIRKRRSN